MCAELHFAVVLPALRSRPAFWPAAAERLVPPHNPPCTPGTGIRAGVPAGLCTRTGWVPAPLPVAPALHLHLTLQRLAPSPFPLEGWWGAPGALLLPALYPRSSLLPAGCCGEDGCTREGTGCGRVRTGWWGAGRSCTSEGGEGRLGPSLSYNQPHTAASTKKYCRDKPHTFSKVRLACAYAYVRTDTLFKMHHHNCLSISYTTPSTVPLTPYWSAYLQQWLEYLWYHCNFFFFFISTSRVIQILPITTALSQLSLDWVCLAFLPIQCLCMYFNTSYLYMHIKACWAYKTKCCSGKKAHKHPYIWSRNPTLKSLRSSIPAVCYQLLLNYNSCSVRGKAAASIKATVSYPFCLCPSLHPSTSISSLL